MFIVRNIYQWLRPLKVDPAISKLIQLIEQKDDAIRELKGRVDGDCTCIRLILENIYGNIIETQMKTANDFNSFGLKENTICNRIDMLENKIMN